MYTERRVQYTKVLQGSRLKTPERIYMIGSPFRYHTRQPIIRYCKVNPMPFAIPKGFPVWYIIKYLDVDQRVQSLVCYGQHIKYGRPFHADTPPWLTRDLNPLKRPYYTFLEFPNTDHNVKRIPRGQTTKDSSIFTVLSRGYTLQLFIVMQNASPLYDYW